MTSNKSGGVPIGVIALAVGVIGGLGSFAYYRWGRAETTRGHLEAFYLLAGHRVLSVEATTRFRRGSDGHLALVDARDGKRLARVRADAMMYAGSSPSGLWFRDTAGDLGLHRRDPATLAVQVAQPAWSASLGGVKVESDLNAGEHAFSLLSNDGRFLLLDPESLATRPAADRVYGAPAEPGHSEYHRGLIDGTADSFDSPGKLRVELEGTGLPSEQRAVHCRKQPVGFVFISPKLVGGRRDGIVVDDSFFVVHRRALGTDSSLQLSRVGCQGAAQWTVNLASSHFLAALLDGDQLLVTTRNSDGFDDLHAFAVSDGQRRWSYAF